MKAEGLREQMPVIVTGGPLKGEKGTVVDPTPVPDGQPDQRKVLIKFDWAEHYILPRQIDIDPDALMANVQSAALPQAAIVTNVSPAPSASALRSITDPMDPALDPFRPDPSIVAEYKNRHLPGGYLDTDYMLGLRDLRDGDGYSPNVALVGPTQAGKTMFVQVLAVLAAEKDGMPKPYPVFTVSGSAGLSSYDLYGTHVPVIDDQGNEVLVWMEGIVPMAARCGAFLYLDEWNSVPPSQAVCMHSLMDDRRQFVNTKRPVADGYGGFFPDVVKANTNMWIISTINPTGYRGTQAMAEATSNRFRWLDWGYDKVVEKSIIKSESVRTLGELLRGTHEMGTMSTPVGTSALYRLNQDLANFGAENAVWSFLGMFSNPADKVVVQEIIDVNDIISHMDLEYPSPLFT